MRGLVLSVLTMVVEPFGLVDEGRNKKIPDVVWDDETWGWILGGRIRLGGTFVKYTFFDIYLVL